MSEKDPQDQQARPTGKRQLSGASTISSDSYQAKRAQVARTEADSEKLGGGPAAFLPEVVSEVRKVVWPTGREMLNYTLIVFAFLIIMTVIVWGVDTLASMGIGAILTP